MSLSEFSNSAPSFTVPSREIIAVEHPMVVKNVENGLKTFNSNPPLRMIFFARQNYLSFCHSDMTQMLDGHGDGRAIPLYLRYSDPTSAPIVSHNTATKNVLVKITVPKRTGRKRKRGSEDPYILDPSSASVGSENASERSESSVLRSHSRHDRPQYLLRSLKDNVDKYTIEPVGVIEQTHRFRGLSDFHYSTTHGKFMTQVRDTLLTGQLEPIKSFKFDGKRGVNPVEEIIPPPVMTDQFIPFNWGYRQNSTTKMRTDQQTGDQSMINVTSSNKVDTIYVPSNFKPVPTMPIAQPQDDAVLNEVISQIQNALDVRPIWTRRGLMNQVSSRTSQSLFKHAIQHVAYQFRSGPWRDAVIKFGVDPRTDPKYRIYQTLFFKISAKETREGPWRDMRSEYVRSAASGNLNLDSHMFDGKSIVLDGKVWQICDITDPILKKIASTEQLRDECDIDGDGWFCSGTMAKLKAVMRVKISAILENYHIPDNEFVSALAFPEVLPEKARTVPIPDWRPPEKRKSGMTPYEAQTSHQLTGKRQRRRRLRDFKGRAYGVRSSTTGTPSRADSIASVEHSAGSPQKGAGYEGTFDGVQEDSDNSIHDDSEESDTDD